MNRRVLRLLLFLGFCFYDNASAAEFVVSSPADSGAGSLRQVVLDVNASGETDNVIRFSTGTVTLGSVLPVLTGKCLL